jgi:hypothetical protein
VFLRKPFDGEDLRDKSVRVIHTDPKSQGQNAEALRDPLRTTKFSQFDWAEAEACMFSIDISVPERLLVNRMCEAGTTLLSLCDFCVGIQAYDIHTGQKRSVIETRAYHANSKKDKTFRKELNGNDVSRYYREWTEGNWISYGPWLAHPRQPEFFEGPRVLVREITNVGRYLINADYVEGDYINYKTILNVLLRPESKSRGYHEFYFLALLNSALLSWYFPRASNKLVTETFPRISILDMKRFPVPKLDLSHGLDRKKHTRIVELVGGMLVAKKQLVAARTEREKNFYESKCATIDRQIDNLVYELYNLTPEEIALVEGAGH